MINSDIYDTIDQDFNQGSGGNTNFEALVGNSPYKISPEEITKFQDRYQIIKDFQQKILEVFRASLKGEADAKIYRMVLGDIPAHIGLDYHVNLSERQHTTPVFFCTDEPVLGKLSEIQCPGSGWCIHQQLWTLYRAYPDIFGVPRNFALSVAEQFVQSVRDYVGKDPIIHHLTENASRAHGMRYFIQKTRKYGAKYLSYDHNVGPGDCNFYRAHDFYNILSQNFYSERMRQVETGYGWFDLPPSALFDGKIIMALPFLNETRSLFSDEIRSIFPYTTIIDPDGIMLEDGSTISLEKFCQLPRQKRDYYIKYAGTDISINWGSKSVFLASSGSGKQVRALMDRIIKDRIAGRYWILQASLRTKESISYFNRGGRLGTADGYGKWSGFYGPNGLMGILVFHKNFNKVHGGENTVMSIVY